jgi:hypothetical protein
MTNETVIKDLQDLQQYIKVELYNEVVYSKRMSMIDKIDDIISQLDDSDLEDTPDIMDMGLNELSIGEY